MRTVQSELDSRKTRDTMQDLQQTKSGLCCWAQEEAFLALMWRAAVPVTHTPGSCVESMMSAARARQWQGADWQEHSGCSGPSPVLTRGLPSGDRGESEVIVCSRSVDEMFAGGAASKMEEQLEMKRRPCSCLNGDKAWKEQKSLCLCWDLKLQRKAEKRFVVELIISLNWIQILNPSCSLYLSSPPFFPLSAPLAANQSPKWIMEKEEAAACERLCGWISI